MRGLALGVMGSAEKVLRNAGDVVRILEDDRLYSLPPPSICRRVNFALALLELAAFARLELASTPSTCRNDEKTESYHIQLATTSQYLEACSRPERP